MIYAIGIDPGAITGWAVWDTQEKKFVEIESSGIIHAYRSILDYKGTCKLRIEDARKRTWYGKAGRGKLQGVGSVKRDCKIWVEICEYHSIPYELVHPKNNTTKLDTKTFKSITGWEGQTNMHKRDAGMLVYGI